MTINIVQKYNGGSLYSMKKLREVAAHIASLRGQYENMVIVVGNMGQSTGDLIITDYQFFLILSITHSIDFVFIL